MGIPFYLTIYNPYIQPAGHNNKYDPNNIYPFLAYPADYYSLEQLPSFIIKEFHLHTATMTVPYFDLDGEFCLSTMPWVKGTPISIELEPDFDINVKNPESKLSWYNTPLPVFDGYFNYSPWFEKSSTHGANNDRLFNWTLFDLLDRHIQKKAELLRGVSNDDDAYPKMTFARFFTHLAKFLWWVPMQDNGAKPYIDAAAEPEEVSVAPLYSYKLKMESLYNTIPNPRYSLKLPETDPDYYNPFEYGFSPYSWNLSVHRVIPWPTSLSSIIYVGS